MGINKGSNVGGRWYLLQLKPNGFKRAQLNLTRQNFETFMPLYRETIRQNQIFKQVIRPVFPGYLFVRFTTDSADWRKINSTFGVARLVSFEASEPAIVPDGLVEGLKVRCDEVGLLRSSDDFKVGEKVQMIAGVFSGFVGKIEGFMSDERVKILFDFMGQKGHVEVRHSDILPLAGC